MDCAERRVEQEATIPLICLRWWCFNVVKSLGVGGKQLGIR